MEKREDQDLLELQELALKHKSAKKHKSLEETRMIVKAHSLIKTSPIGCTIHIGKKHKNPILLDIDMTRFGIDPFKVCKIDEFYLRIS